MPPLPKKQLSKGKQRSRAAHYRFRPASLTACGQCHQLILPHRVCPYCGYYKGRQVISVGGTQKRG
jgi:large subunit ribosomal protein L32